MLIKFCLFIALLLAHPWRADAIEVRTNPITGHELTLMPPTKSQPEAFGWIRLLNGAKSAGFIYLVPPSVPAADPHLSFAKDYIVTSMPMSALATLLDVLRNEKNLQIRFFDPQAPGNGPSAFIEPAAGPELAGAKFRTDPEFAKVLEGVQASIKK